LALLPNGMESRFVGPQRSVRFRPTKLIIRSFIVAVKAKVLVAQTVGNWSGCHSVAW
jgi:hypothetical protein